MASKIGKRMLVAALGVAALTAGLVATPAAADPEPTGGQRHSHEVPWRLKPQFTQYTTDGGTTWVNEEPPGFRPTGAEYSNDGGMTWEATLAEYTTGEAGESDGGNAGTFRFRSVPHTTRNVWPGHTRWSLDAGATWTQIGEQTSPAGWAFANAGHWRQRIFVCIVVGGGEATPESGSGEQVVTEIGGPSTEPTSPRCLEWHSNTGPPPHATNVDDGVEPLGDWCASGASTIICRGEEYTYRQARRALGF